MSEMAGPIRHIAIVGAGHGGFAAAADLSARGFQVRLYGRSETTIAPVRTRGGVEIAGALGEGLAPIALATSDLGEAMDGADLVLLASPTHAHAEVASAIAPHLVSTQTVLATPGHTLLLIPNILRAQGKPVDFCETATLPYIARKHGPAAVTITQCARHLVFAAFPGRRTAELAALIRPVFPAIQPAAHLLETVFPYTNAIHHPPAVLGNVGRIEATQGDFHHYFDGISPSVGRIIDALDRERLAIAAAFGCAPLPFVEYFFRNGYTTAEARDSRSAYEAFHQSEPDRWIRAPQTLDHRFLNEDIPFGLALLSELARMAAVATPTIDHVIHLAAAATGRDFRAEGLTLARVGLDGRDPAGAVALLHEGHLH